MKLQPVVLSGGAGTRLWPLSREFYPKQLLSLAGDNTLLQDTLTRLDGLEQQCDRGQLESADALIVCNEEHRFLVAEQVRKAGRRAAGIVLEPCGRNTAPALTLAALHIRAHDDDALMMVMPADHVIADLASFQQAVCAGIEPAGQGKLVTFGIVPTRPETGYGYIKMGSSITVSDASLLTPHLIDAFVEKPDAATAGQYVDSGEYLWNSGMFMMSASVWLNAMQQFQPEMLAACTRAWQDGREDMDFYRVARDAFEGCSSDSIDYAVMEKITTASAGGLQGAVIPLAAGWSDIGSFPALWEVASPDENGNVSRGDVYTHETRGSLLLSEGRLLATVGVSDLVVVETADAVLVLHKDHAQDVKKIVERIRSDERSEHLMHRRVHRPWGSYEGIDVGDRFQVKRITVNPGSSLSMQMHHHRAEHWIVVRGTAEVTRGDEVFLLTENQSTYIPIGERHRLVNPGSVPLELIEVQSGSYLGEDDIVRFEDVYGRDKDK